MKYQLSYRKAACLGNGTRPAGTVVAMIDYDGDDPAEWLEATVRAAMAEDRNPAEDLAKPVKLARGANWDEIRMLAVNPAVMRFEDLDAEQRHDQRERKRQRELAAKREKAAQTKQQAPHEAAAETSAEDDRPDVRAFLESQKKDELLDLAAEQEIDVPAKIIKEELIERLAAAYEQQTETN